MKRISAGSMLGWLLLAVCAALMAIPAWPKTPKQPAAYRSAGYAAEMPPIPVCTGTVDVNRADAAALTALPGVGESIAAAILKERAANGPFFYPEDLCAVRGIGPAKAAEFRLLLNLEGTCNEVE